MVARMDRGAEVEHRRVRAALKAIPEHAGILALAYGVILRSRDIDDGAKRRAPKAAERNWRVRFAELYGKRGAYVLPSRKAQQLYKEHIERLGDAVADALPDISERRVEEERLFVVIPEEARAAIDAYEHGRAAGLIAWLLGAGRGYSLVIEADARKHLHRALDAFIAHYDASAPKRTRNVARMRERLLASHPENGQEIGG